MYQVETDQDMPCMAYSRAVTCKRGNPKVGGFVQFLFSHEVGGFVQFLFSLDVIGDVSLDFRAARSAADFSPIDSVCAYLPYTVGVQGWGTPDL